MKPAACCLCGKYAYDEGPDKKNDWVTFKNYSEQPISLSHPDGLEFFCSEHLSAALKLTHLQSDDAIDKLKSGF